MNRLEKKFAFTLIELIVVLGIIFVLIGLLLPVVKHGISHAQLSQCSSNLRQLFLANQLYAAENGHYVAAAEDINWSMSATTVNYKRWHGERNSLNASFDGSRGPLVPYLGTDKAIRRCPALKKVDTESNAAYEKGCGGYGYNDRGVGSQAYLKGFNSRGSAKGMPPGCIKRPAATVMFADTAIISGGDLIEYSFAEAYFHVKSSKKGGKSVESSSVASPSIHFRHNGKANVVWCDGHISAEEMTVEKSKTFTEYNLGWFGPADNTLFDPY